MSVISESFKDPVETMNFDKWIHTSFVEFCDPNQNEKETQKPLEQRIKLIRNEGKVSEYLIDSYLKVSVPSKAYGAYQSTEWKKLSDKALYSLFKNFVLGAIGAAVVIGVPSFAARRYHWTRITRDIPLVVSISCLLGALYILVQLLKISSMLDQEKVWRGDYEKMVTDITQARAKAYANKKVYAFTLRFANHSILITEFITKALKILSPKEAEYLSQDAKA